VKSAKRQFDPQAFLAIVGTGKEILKYRKGRIIFAQGEEADKIFYIQSGKVKVTVVSEQGKEAVVGILDAAQFFGEGCLNGQAVRIGTARAMEESVITSITRKAMLAALRREPNFSELFVTYLVTRSNRVEEDLIDQLFNSR
jgi:CRP-like cAMP-binding protein